MRYSEIRYSLFLLAFVFSCQVHADIHQEATYKAPLSAFRVTSEFGMRNHPVENILRHHDGIDLAAAAGTPIHAIERGLVAFAGSFGGYGKIVVLIHPGGMTSHYAHCSTFSVLVGEVVERGQTIGRVGDTGTATGPHLHFELRRSGKPLNPVPVL
jgi:murein DD-endopeptidase MepM/ murein hydrolase activator NlpD